MKPKTASNTLIKLSIDLRRPASHKGQIYLLAVWLARPDGMSEQPHHSISQLIPPSSPKFPAAGFKAFTILHTKGYGH